MAYPVLKIERQVFSMSGSTIHPISITFQTLLDGTGFRVTATFNSGCAGKKCLFFVNTTQTDVEELNSDLKEVTLTSNWQFRESVTIDENGIAAIDTANNLGRFGVTAYCPNVELVKEEL